jgi:hypothetical protein
MRRVPIPVFVLLGLAGLLPRILGLPLWGTFDVEIQKAWAARAATGGISDIYGPSDRELAQGARQDGRPLLRWLREEPFPQHVFAWQGNSYFVDYPPASVLVLWAEGSLYRLIAPEMPNRRAFNACINLGAFAGSLAVVLLLWRSSVEQGARRAALYWLNPAMVLAVPILGYQDTIFGAFALAALLAVARERWEVASALTVVAGLVKPQGALLVPILLVGLLRDARPRRWLCSALSALAAAAIVLAPWWTTGHLLSALDGCLRPLRQPTLSALGPNLWWIAGWVMKWSQHGAWPLASIATIADFREWAGVEPRLVGRVALLVATAGIALWLGRRPRTDRAAFAVAAVVLVHAYALVSTSVHENHTFFAVLAALVVVGTVVQAERIAAATSAFLMISIFLMAGGLGRRIMTLGQLDVIRMAFGLDLSVILSAAHAVLVVSLVIWMLRTGRSPAP